MSAAWLVQLDELWRGVALHLWQTSLLLLLVALVGLGLRSAPARFSGLLLGVGLARLLLPLAWVQALVASRLPTLDGTGAARIVEYVEVVLRPAGLATPAAAYPAHAQWPVMVSAAWLGGAALVLTGWVRRWRRTGRGEGGADRLSCRVRERLRCAARESDIDVTAIRVVPGTGTPAVHGVWRPKIVLPQRVVELLPQEELRAVLLHELHHVRRRDTLRELIRGVALLLFFFYPPVWWLVRRLRATAEAACDEAVIRRGIAPALYARALARVVHMQLAGPALAAPCEVALGGGSLRGRLERIESIRRYRAMPRHRWLLTAFALVLVVALAAPVLQADREKKEPAAPGEALESAVDPLDRLVSVDQPVRLPGGLTSLEALFTALERETAYRFPGAAKLRAPIPDAGEVLVPLRLLLRRLAADHRLDYEVVDGFTLKVRSRGNEEILLAGVGDVTSPRLIPASKAQPSYPAKAREDRVKGTVILQAVIDRDGRVGSLEVLRESPRDYGFAQAAERAVSQWRYEPATQGGSPVDVYFTIFVEFQLR